MNIAKGRGMKKEKRATGKVATDTTNGQTSAEGWTLPRIEKYLKGHFRLFIMRLEHEAAAFPDPADKVKTVFFEYKAKEIESAIALLRQIMTRPLKEQAEAAHLIYIGSLGYGNSIRYADEIFRNFQKGGKTHGVLEDNRSLKEKVLEYVLGLKDKRTPPQCWLTLAVAFADDECAKEDAKEKPVNRRTIERWIKPLMPPKPSR